MNTYSNHYDLSREAKIQNDQNSNELSPHEVIQLQMYRESQGRCIKCGVQTHIVNKRKNNNINRYMCSDNALPDEIEISKPMNSEFVLDGRCLLCRPLLTKSGKYTSCNPFWINKDHQNLHSNVKIKNVLLESENEYNVPDAGKEETITSIKSIQKGQPDERDTKNQSDRLDPRMVVVRTSNDTMDQLADKTQETKCSEEGGNKNSSNVDIEENIVLGQSPDANEPSYNKDTICSILIEMETYYLDEKVQQKGLESLRVLARLSSNRDYILSYNNKEVKVTLPEEEPATLVDSVKLVATATMNDHGLSALAIILLSIISHPYDVLIQSLGCQLLHNLACHNDETKSMMLGKNNDDANPSLSCMDVLVKSMKNVPDSADVQMSACMAISNLAPAVGNHYGSSAVGWNNFCGIDMSLVSSSPSHESPVISSGAITSIISAMERHSQHKKLQEHACAALLNISTLGKLEVKAVSSSNGISMLLAAMVNHQQVVEIQANACGALANLAAVLENRETIESKGGIYLFICAMTAHRTEREVQKNGCAALRIVMEDGLFLDTLQELGNVRKILEIASIDFPLECKVNAEFLLKTLNNAGSSPSAYFVW